MRKCFILFLSCFILNVTAESLEVIKETIGVGETKQEAVTDALLEAVQQVRGAEIATRETLEMELSSIVGKDGLIITNITETVNTKAYNRAFGWINTYSILEVRQPTNERKLWEVELKVSVPVYKPVVADDQRTTIAVPVLGVSPTQVELYDPRYSASIISRQLAGALTYQLSRSSGFALLNRDFEQQIQEEKEIWQSGDTPAAASSRLGQKLGADLLLLGRIYRFDIVDVVKRHYDSEVLLKKVDVEILYSVVEAATEKILWSGRQLIDKEYKVNQYAEYEKNYISEVIDYLSNAIAVDVMDSFFPIRILQQQDQNEVILNQGQARLNPGEQLLAYSRGSSVVDPNTGLSIDVKGQQIAELEVIDVNSRYSVAKVVEGDVDSISIDTVIKKAKPAVLQDTPTPSVRQAPGSGEEPLKW